MLSLKQRRAERLAYTFSKPHAPVRRSNKGKRAVKLVSAFNLGFRNKSK
jgi:hypothetical protein